MEDLEISMIRVRASPPQSGQVAVNPSRHQSKSPSIQVAAIIVTVRRLQIDWAVRIDSKLD